MIIISFFSIKHVSGFFYAPTTYVSIELVYQKVLFSDSSVSKMFFELESISKNRTSNYRGFTDSRTASNVYMYL